MCLPSLSRRVTRSRIVSEIIHPLNHPRPFYDPRFDDPEGNDNPILCCLFFAAGWPKIHRFIAVRRYHSRREIFIGTLPDLTSRSNVMQQLALEKELQENLCRRDASQNDSGKGSLCRPLLSIARPDPPRAASPPSWHNTQSGGFHG